jgi:GT2 family glycosyltransferase
LREACQLIDEIRHRSFIASSYRRASNPKSVIMPENLEGLGAVVIGRNEGERLKRCLRSIPPGVPIVYVDSASSDGSADYAREQGANVIELDMKVPFTAARARNEGFEALIQIEPRLKFVQFVDGDCEIEPGWLAVAIREMETDDLLAVVCGRRRERFPVASFYNALCDEEWNTPVGEAKDCGGDAVIRASGLRQAGSFDPVIVAGEEPELCKRLRGHGWLVRRIGAPMTIHDADMHHLHQWWRRTVRGGYGYAQVWHKTATGTGGRLFGKELGRAVFWTLGVPALGLAVVPFAGPIALLGVPAIWAAQLIRLGIRNGWRKGAHLFLAKFAETQGALGYAHTVLFKRRKGTIFYK